MEIKINKMVAVTVFFMSFFSHANDDNGAIPVYSSTRPLVIKAFNDGEAYGIIQGPIAKKISSMTKSSNPVYAKFTLLNDDPKKEGCYFVEMYFTQKDVKFGDGEVEPVTMKIKSEVCKNTMDP